MSVKAKWRQVTSCRFLRGGLLAFVGVGMLLIAGLVATERHADAKTWPRLSYLPKDGVVLAFGDSITYGIGAVYDENYPAVLERMIGRKVVTAGVPGELTSRGLKRLPQLLDRFHPHIVIICHGGNDLIHGLDERQVAGNIRAMIRVAQEKGTQVVLVGVPRIHSGSPQPPPPFYRQIAAEFGIPFTGDALTTILENRAYRADVLHPNGEGYRQLAEVLAHLLHMSGAI